VSPRIARPWFRFYTEAMGDQKLRTLKPAHRWLWVGVLAAARQSPEAGVLLVTESMPHRGATLADFVGLTPREVVTGMNELEDRGMVERDELGRWVVPRFRDRQYESDTSTERTRRHRSRERGRNVPTSADGTDFGTAPETETESPPSGGDARAPFEAEFEEVWYFWPRKLDKAGALVQYQARRRAGRTQAELMRAVVTFAEHHEGDDVQFLPYLKTFIGKNGQWVEWLDGVPLDAMSNQDLGVRAWSPTEPPSGPSMVPDPDQPRRALDDERAACVLGECDGSGFVDVDGGARACRCRNVRASA